jgi:O-antigen ligase
LTTINEVIIPQQKKAGYANVVVAYFNVIALLIVIIAGLINTEYFYSPTATAYYGFCISALFFVIVSTSLYLTKEAILTIIAPLFLFGIWCLYILWHYFTHTGTLVFTIYSLTLYFLLLKATTFFSTPNFKFKSLLIGIAGIATIESLYCISQYIGFFKSQNVLFEVTGSCINPNSTAMFLALTVPIFLFLFQSKHKRLFFGGFILVLIGLLLLKCRAAYIGATISIIVFYGLEYNFFSWLKNRKNKVAAKALFILCLLIVIPTFIHLYNSKKASSDGRKFIWKISAMMSTKKPLTGYGYGSFEKEYNLYQADYIAKGKATLEEQTTAGPTFMAYNEAIQNIVEGGAIGLLLILLFFGSLLFSIRQKRKVNLNCTINVNQDELPAKNRVFHLAYAGAIGFMTMSMFNFAIQAVSVMTILIIYSAMICSQIDSVSISSTLSFLNTKWVKLVTKITICISCLYLLFALLHIAQADMLNKKAAILKKEGHLKEAFQIMPKIEYWQKEESNYWKNYGNILFLNKEYSKALKCLSKAKTTSSTPDLYLGSGVCYEKLHQYPKAIIQYQQLVLLNPSKFNYRFRLMTAYLKNKDTLNTLLTAQGIINLKPKIPSEEVVQFKKTAFKIGLALDENFKNKLSTKKLSYSLDKKLN